MKLKFALETQSVFIKLILWYTSGMHILTIYCDKNMVTAAIFPAEAQPKIELVARLIVDKKTQDMSAKVYDRVNFRSAVSGMTATPLEKGRIPSGGRTGAVDWLIAWLARQGVRVEHTLIGYHINGQETLAAVKAKIQGGTIRGVSRPEALAEWAWTEVECKRRVQPAAGQLPA